MYKPVGLALAFRPKSDTVWEDGRDSRGKPRERSRDRERDRKGTRSRSPRRDRGRDDERDIERGTPRDTEREKSKSVKPEDENPKSRTSTPPVSFKVGASGAQDHDRMDVDSRGKDSVADSIEDDEDIVVEDDGMAAMQAMMGFGGFATTHQKKVPGNDISAVRKEKKTEYRQYMNRVGGFNRPLSPTREL
jgi:U4/U6.U5 tri-snRNP-associated protein 3